MLIGFQPGVLHQSSLESSDYDDRIEQSYATVYKSVLSDIVGFSYPLKRKIL